MSTRGRPPTRFGLFIGQIGLSWDELVERFRLADDLGFDHAWLVDHLMPTDPPHDRPCFEAWTSLAGLAALTKRVQLGVLVSSNTFRHPALLAKQAVTVDHISGGRLILGVGTGWYEPEHRRFGLEFPGPRERVKRLEEALEILESLLTGEEASHAGAYYQLDRARALPGPVQRPRIPILVAAHRPRMLTLAARHADIWDTFATTPGTATDGVGSSLAERVERFELACRAVARDPGAVRRSTWVDAAVFHDMSTYSAFVERHLALGFTDLIAGMPPSDGWDTVRLVAAQLIPQVREAEAGSPERDPAERPVPIH